jgi:hypothetical protein
MGVGAEPGDQLTGLAGADMQALADGFRGDGAMVLLPVQDVFGAGSVEQVLLLSRPPRRARS